jgi:hypothetical protein
MHGSPSLRARTHMQWLLGGKKEKRAQCGEGGRGEKSANAQHSVILTRRSAQALTHSLYAFIGSASEVAFLRGESIEVEITTDSHATKSFFFLLPPVSVQCYSSIMLSQSRHFVSRVFGARR